MGWAHPKKLLHAIHSCDETCTLIGLPIHDSSPPQPPILPFESAATGLQNNTTHRQANGTPQYTHFPYPLPPGHLERLETNKPVDLCRFSLDLDQQLSQESTLKSFKQQTSLMCTTGEVYSKRTIQPQIYAMATGGKKARERGRDEPRERSVGVLYHARYFGFANNLRATPPVGGSAAPLASASVADSKLTDLRGVGRKKLRRLAVVVLLEASDAGSGAIVEVWLDVLSWLVLELKVPLATLVKEELLPLLLFSGLRLPRMEGVCGAAEAVVRVPP